MKNRVLQPELMNAQAMPADRHQEAISVMANLNQCSGISAAIYRHLRRQAKQTPSRTLRLLDVASGSGALPIDWARRAQRDSLRLQISTLDISAEAIAHQQAAAKKVGVSLHAIEGDALANALPGTPPGGYDVVTSLGFMHCLNDHQVFCLLQSMQQVASRSILVCDLNRSRTNLVLMSLRSRLFCRSRVVRQNATARVRSAFTQNEFAAIAERALARPVHMQRVFPGCFLMTFDGEITEKLTVDPQGNSVFDFWEAIA